MAIKFKHGGVLFTADTPEEAARVVTLLKQQDAEAWTRAPIEHGGVLDSVMATAEEYEMWTPHLFVRFMARLGAQQKTALSWLVAQRSATDEELRTVVNVRGNQALAGILSGISKQAAALNIPARSVFSFENLRTSGKRRSTYTVADSFRRIATEMHESLHQKNKPSDNG